MARWRFEPGHTAAEFSVRHMMGCYVRGHFKNIQGTLEVDPEYPEGASIEVAINVSELWTGEGERDDHLLSDHFLDASNHPQITFKSTAIRRTAGTEYKVTGDLTIRGTTRPVTLDVRFLGQGRSPFNDVRIGFLATTHIYRHDFGVSWNANMLDYGAVVGDDVLIVIDAEAILEGDLETVCRDVIRPESPDLRSEGVDQSAP